MKELFNYLLNIELDIELSVETKLILEIELSKDELENIDNLYLNYTKITKLPDNLVVNGWIGLENTKISKLPKNLTIKDNLYINDSGINNLPDDLKVGGYIVTSDNNRDYLRAMFPKFKHQIH